MYCMDSQHYVVYDVKIFLQNLIYHLHRYNLCENYQIFFVEIDVHLLYTFEEILCRL